MNMAIHDFKYDVAFSFLKEVEELAIRLNDLLQDRLKTFLYSKRQEGIAGTDGEETFSRVFGAEARVVVVLYRPSWGSTPWTRIEATAIRNRAYEEGYDFTIFVPLDDPPSVPKWLPRTRIWVGLDRWGLEGAASVIEARVQEAGGTPRKESVEERAARLKRELATERERQQFLNSSQGVKAALSETEILIQEIGRISQTIADPAAQLTFRFEFNDRMCALYSHGYTLTVAFHLQWANTLEQSSLRIALWKGAVGSGRWISINEPELKTEQFFEFDRAPTGTLGWRRKAKDKRFFPTLDLAGYCVNFLLDQIGDILLKSNK